MSSTTIQDVSEDVLVRILSFSGHLLRHFRVNRSLRRIALVKQLWISLIKNLIERNLLEVPPDFIISQNSTVGLIDQIKGVLTGPQTWVPTAEQSPTPFERIVVPANIKRTGGWRGDSKIKLVNGGRQIVIAHRAAVEIWDVATKRRLWTRPVFAVNFNVDLREFGTNITLVILLEDRVTLEIAQIDTSFGEKQVLPYPSLHRLGRPSCVWEAHYSPAPRERRVRDTDN
ncbi:hypothetical protein FB451DRAFT_1253046, partial [Mycena latifolia]